LGFLEKGFEFDFSVAEHVGVGGEACAEVAEKALKDVGLILFDEVYTVVGDVELRAHFDDIFVFAGGLALASLVGLFPVFHEKADDFIAGFFEQKSGDR